MSTLVERLEAAAEEVMAFPHPSHCDHLHRAHEVMREAAASLRATTGEGEWERPIREGWYRCARCHDNGQSDDCTMCGGSGVRKRCGDPDCIEHGCCGKGKCEVPKSALAAPPPPLRDADAWLVGDDIFRSEAEARQQGSIATPIDVDPEPLRDAGAALKCLRDIVVWLGPNVPSSVTDEGARHEWHSALRIARRGIAALTAAAKEGK